MKRMTLGEGAFKVQVHSKAYAIDFLVRITHYPTREAGLFLILLLFFVILYSTLLLGTLNILGIQGFHIQQ